MAGKRRNILSGDAAAPASTGEAGSPAPPAGQPFEGSGAEGFGSGAEGGPGEGDWRHEAQSANISPVDQPKRLRAAIDPPRDLACDGLEMSDLGNAERWAIRSGADFRFCAEIGWFHWDGRRWHLLSEEKDRLPAAVMQSVFLTVRAIRNEAALVAATGCEEPLEFSTPRAAVNWRMEALSIEGKARAKYLRGDEDGSRERWVDQQRQMNRAIDVGKRKFLSAALLAWAKTSEGKGKLDSVAALAKSFPGIAIEPAQLDADRMAINVLNGTLRFVRKPEKRQSDEVAGGKSVWRTGSFSVRIDPHRRDDLLTKLAPVKFAPNAKAAEYDAFMAAVQPDEAMRRFIHQWGGLSLTGDISEQKLAFFYGSGSNGKGTWVETIAAIAGDYAGSIPIESFLDNGGKRRGDQATPDIARLPGVRFLRVSEPEKGASLNEGLVKMITGGDPVDARHLNKGFFTFLPSFKMTISGNHKPKIKDTSNGIWRRMQLVPWEVQIANDQVDKKLGDRMREGEASGILNRLIGGLIDWLDNGLIEPDQVRDATRAYRDDSDELGRFLSAVCEVSDDPKIRVNATDLWQIYEAWAQASGREPWKRNGFVNAMRDKGFSQISSNGVWWIKLRPRIGVTVDGIKSGDWSAPADDISGQNGAEGGDRLPGWDDD